MSQSETTADLHDPALLISNEPIPLKYLQTAGASTNQVPQFNGTTVVWATVGGGGGITALTGDVKATGSGSVVATVEGWEGKKLDSGFTAPTGGFRPWYDGASGTWKLAAQSGDITGTAGTTQVVGWKGVGLSGGALLANQTYVYDGAGLAPRFVPSNNTGTFADNAAALTGGLTAGMFYVASGAGAIAQGTVMRVY